MADLLVNFDNNGEILCPCFHLLSQGGEKPITMYCRPCYHSTSLLWVPFISLQGIVSYRYLTALGNYTKQKLQECTFNGSVIAFQGRRNNGLIRSTLDMIHDSGQCEIIIKCAWYYFITFKRDIKEFKNVVVAFLIVKNRKQDTGRNTFFFFFLHF